MAIVVVSESDAQKHGCPWCNYAKSYLKVSGGNTAIVGCSKCGHGYYVVQDGHAASSWNDKPRVVPHPRPFPRWM